MPEFPQQPKSGLQLPSPSSPCLLAMEKPPQHTLRLINERMAGAFHFFSWHKTQRNESIGVLRTSYYQSLCHLIFRAQPLSSLPWICSNVWMSDYIRHLALARGRQCSSSLQTFFLKLNAINLFLFKWQMGCSLALGKLMWGKWTYMVW